MTCILALTHPGGVIMGADGMAALGSDGSIRAAKTGPKLWRWGCRMLAGASGDLYAIQALRYGWAPPRDRRTDPFVYLVRDFVPAMRRYLAGIPDGLKDARGQDAFVLLLAYRDRVFSVATRGDVAESACGYMGVGYCQTALGALYATRDWPRTTTPERRVMLALEAEAANSTFVGPPFHVERI